MLAANALLTVLSLGRNEMSLDHDCEGQGVLVPGQRKSPVHLVGGGGCYDQTLS